VIVVIALLVLGVAGYLFVTSKKKKGGGEPTKAFENPMYGVQPAGAEGSRAVENPLYQEGEEDGEAGGNEPAYMDMPGAGSGGDGSSGGDGGGNEENDTYLEVGGAMDLTSGNA
jgi:hypothetical protein